MIYLSDNLIEIQHLGLGKYEGETFKTLIIPERIQTIRVQGPNVYLDGPLKGTKTFQVIYSYKGYTESFVIDETEYVELTVFKAFGIKGLECFHENLAGPNQKMWRDAVDMLTGEVEQFRDALFSYIRKELAKED